MALNTSFVIPSCAPSNLRLCIERILQRDNFLPEKIIVIDDAPGVAEVASSFGVVVLKGQKPFIIARNLNAGIEAAGEDNVVCINDDALLETEGGFTKMVRAALAAGVGLCSAAMMGRAHSYQHPQPGGSLRFVASPLRINFSCCFVPRSTINRIGFLDEDFVGYGFDDDDYCIRVREAGLSIAVHDGCVVDHRGRLAKPTMTDTEEFQHLVEVAGAVFRKKWGNR